MQFIIRGDNTKSIKDYIETKLSKLDKYINSEDCTATILTKKEGRNQKIEVTIPTKEFTLRNEAVNEDRKIRRTASSCGSFCVCSKLYGMLSPCVRSRALRRR